MKKFIVSWRSTLNPNLIELYHTLLSKYGPQGWWPLITHDGSNPTKSGAHSGYHPSDYSFPKTREDQFEIAVGAILTQNTAWTSVEKVLKNLWQERILHDPQKILDCPDEHFKELIRSAGYNTQKCRYIKTMAEFFLFQTETPSRHELLALHGVGEETADAILLYAFSVPSFVVDAYTKRFLTFHGIIEGTTSYRSIQTLFHRSIPHEVPLFQEYHALIVEWGKRQKTKKFSSR